MSSATGIDVKHAVASAVAFIQKVYGNLPGLLLEEVEMTEDGAHWLITLGFDQPVPQTEFQKEISGTKYGVIPNPTRRVYKLIKVDAATGEAVSMKIRQV